MVHVRANNEIDGACIMKGLRNGRVMDRLLMARFDSIDYVIAVLASVLSTEHGWIDFTLLFCFVDVGRIFEPHCLMIFQTS